MKRVMWRCVFAVATIVGIWPVADAMQQEGYWPCGSKMVEETVNGVHTKRHYSASHTGENPSVLVQRVSDNFLSSDGGKTFIHPIEMGLSIIDKHIKLTEALPEDIFSDYAEWCQKEGRANEHTKIADTDREQLVTPWDSTDLSVSYYSNLHLWCSCYYQPHDCTDIDTISQIVAQFKDIYKASVRGKTEVEKLEASWKNKTPKELKSNVSEYMREVHSKVASEKLSELISNESAMNSFSNEFIEHNLPYFGYTYYGFNEVLPGVSTIMQSYPVTRPFVELLQSATALYTLDRSLDPSAALTKIMGELRQLVDNSLNVDEKNSALHQFQAIEAQCRQLAQCTEVHLKKQAYETFLGMWHKAIPIIPHLISEQERKEIAEDKHICADGKANPLIERVLELGLESSVTKANRIREKHKGSVLTADEIVECPQPVHQENKERLIQWAIPRWMRVTGIVGGVAAAGTCAAYYFLSHKKQAEYQPEICT